MNIDTQTSYVHNRKVNYLEAYVKGIIEKNNKVQQVMNKGLE